MINKNRNLKFMMILNIILISLLYGDFLLPSNNITNDKFLLSQTNVSGSASWKGRNYQNVENILEFQSQLFRIARIPDYLENFEGKTVQIKRTLLFSKIKSINLPVEDNDIFVSVLSLPGIFIAFLLALTITIINFFSTNTVLEFIMSFACTYIYFVTIVYFFYLS